MNDAVICSAVRTPIGSFQGSLSSVSAVDLGAIAIRSAVERAHVMPADVNETIMGMVLSAGVGQAPARQASIGAGVPESVPCTTVNKVCGSGLKSVMLAQHCITVGDCQMVVAGGMENMSQAPYLLPQARGGYRMGPGEVVDAMIHDGLWDPFGKSGMGAYGDLCAQERGFSRESQDAYAIRSYERARAAQVDGAFEAEIAAVDVVTRKATNTIAADEEPSRFLPEKIPQLRPAFSAEGTVTAANASKISDGAAAVVVMDQKAAAERQSPVLARIISSASFAHQPQWFTTAPAFAIRRVLDRAGLSVEQIDLFEINEAFAVVAMAAISELSLNADRVNVNGGAISLGHPIGCSGTRVLVTLIHALRRQNKRYGCASLCIGGGEAVAMIVENPEV
ncbi:MAG: thiolase family protein [Planctomycetaceae bacterium]|nr:thiolase family protein [Planctomycetaceae bacterium]